ncbi:hypothetical protein QUF84_01195 [Fictibacillus enclensis]|uniref:hypothetical protein n=1 Tax=Fictibacillus enclensis TaxID=1017270 RepID=UPI0024BFD28C|nr:hypothetical protein [Fictibacillus enclensis]MDM5335906.1 hypothetical protein [Fictibacillus enclensis]WHY71216.1 hypothetical protein QNH15_19695 [Fictibacillus enclensis]
MEKKSYYHFIVYYKDKLVFDGDEHALKEMAPSFEAKPPYKVLVPASVQAIRLIII